MRLFELNIKKRKHITISGMIGQKLFDRVPNAFKLPSLADLFTLKNQSLSA